MPLCSSISTTSLSVGCSFCCIHIPIHYKHYSLVNSFLYMLPLDLTPGSAATDTAVPSPASLLRAISRRSSPAFSRPCLCLFTGACLFSWPLAPFTFLPALYYLPLHSPSLLATSPCHTICGSPTASRAVCGTTRHIANTVLARLPRAQQSSIRARAARRGGDLAASALGTSLKHSGTALYQARLVRALITFASYLNDVLTTTITFTMARAAPHAQHAALRVLCARRATAALRTPRSLRAAYWGETSRHGATCVPRACGWFAQQRNDAPYAALPRLKTRSWRTHAARQRRHMRAGFH